MAGAKGMGTTLIAGDGLGGGGGLGEGGGGEGEGERELGGGDLRGDGGGGERCGGGFVGGHALAAVFNLSCASVGNMPGVGLLRVPDSATPTFPRPLELIPQLWLPVLPLPKLLIPRLFRPKLRYPTLLRPTLPLRSATHLEAPAGTHSTTMSHLQDPLQQGLPVLRSMALAAPLSTSRVAAL